MANSNNQLQTAKKAREDEFYTQLCDIENELRHYRAHFNGKTVLCNCDDPRVSNFFKYFALNFEILGLKRLIATCYKNNEPDLFSMNTCEQAIYIIYDGDKNGNKVPDPSEMDVLPLQGDGDFRSSECIELLKQADIVCTNPPFSLFREYITQLLQYGKKFLIIGPQGAISYKCCFQYIKQNKLWLGYGFHRNCAHFYTKYEDTATDRDHREGMIRVPSVTWFTNLEIDKRHEDIILYKQYSPEEYPKYVNYDAINVNKTSDIPVDYDGEMGVPITFMYKYNPDQFEIIGSSGELGVNKPSDLPKEKQGGPAFYTKENGEYQRLYNRIVIKRRKK